MELYYIVVLFILGTVFGSFFNVVGWRLPKGESIMYPPSHCPKCNKKLSFFELIPILSYMALGGKCHNCHNKISLFYPLSELVTGILFALAFLIFGFTIDLLIALIFISTLVVVFISDYQTMIIPDEVLIASTIALCLAIFFKGGLGDVIISLINGMIAFLFMLLLKSFGDYMFKKEAMGGGDIKLLFIFGLYLGWPMAVISIFVGSVIGLPISLIILFIKKNNVIAFGPFLSMGALLITLLKIDIDLVLKIIT